MPLPSFLFFVNKPSLILQAVALLYRFICIHSISYSQTSNALFNSRAQRNHIPRKTSETDCVPFEIVKEIGLLRVSMPQPQQCFCGVNVETETNHETKEYSNKVCDLCKHRIISYVLSLDVLKQFKALLLEWDRIENVDISVFIEIKLKIIECLIATVQLLPFMVPILLDLEFDAVFTLCISQTVEVTQFLQIENSDSKSHQNYAYTNVFVLMLRLIELCVRAHICVINTDSTQSDTRSNIWLSPIQNLYIRLLRRPFVPATALLSHFLWLLHSESEHARQICQTLSKDMLPLFWSTAFSSQLQKCLDQNESHTNDATFSATNLEDSWRFAISRLSRTLLTWIFISPRPSMMKLLFHAMIDLTFPLPQWQTNDMEKSMEIVQVIIYSLL